MEETQAQDDRNECKPEPQAKVFAINMMWYFNGIETVETTTLV